MRIVPKYQKPSSGIRYTSPNEGGKNWRTMIFNPYRQHILDTLNQYGEADDYGSWLNEMQSRHAKLYNNAGGAGGNWQNVAYTSPEVGQYQHDYRGDQRFGTVALPSDYKYDFNQTGIQNGQNNNRYDFFGKQQRIEKDRGSNKYTVDNLYSAITDDRRLLGRKEDWDENSDEFKNWQSELNKRGWETYLDPADNYYKLRRLSGNGNPNNPNNPNPNNPNGPNGSVPAQTRNRYGLDPDKFKNLGPQFLTGLLSTGRLLGTLKTNSKVYGEQLKGIRPNLQQGFETHQRIHGDEGTRQQYYRRAAAGESQAARAMTSDAVRQYAQQQEARRIGDELRAQGDLIDNQMIRQTGQQSKAEEDANTERRTQVVNYNNTEINRANKDYHDLLAAKHAANWTSKDNFLQGIEYRLRQRAEEDRAYQRQLDALDAQYKMQNDEEYLKLYNDYSKAWDTAAEKYDNDINKMNADPEFKKAKQAFQDKQYQLRRQQIEGLRRNRSNWSIFAKKGTTLKFKTKDDLLYKTARDAVDHFRKMVKMTSDATIASRSKPIKLKGVPKSTIKMQTGGVAPFVIYKPVALGGEQGVSTNIDPTVGRQGSGNGGSDKKQDTALDVIKDLFKNVEGLPSDVNKVLNSMTAFLAKSEAFGNELSTGDIASLYLKQLQKLNNIKYSKATFDQAKKIAEQNDALNEFAVDNMGRVVVQDTSDGKIKTMSWNEAKKSMEDGKINILTNNNLLSLRAIPETFSFRDDLSDIVSNGVGVSKIIEFIRAQQPKLGESDETIEGYTKKQSNQIKAGFEQLLQEAPDGDYQYTKKTEEQKEQIRMAFNYIKSILPRNMKTVLEIHANLQGTSTDNMIHSLLGSQEKSVNELKFQAVTGKAAKDADGNSKDGSMSPAMAFFMGFGERQKFNIQDKTSDALQIDVNSMPLLDSSGNGLGNATLQQISNGEYTGQLDWNSATMGDVKISPNGTNHVLISGGKIYSTELPIDEQAAAKGIIKPDLSFLKQKEKADQEIRQLGIRDRENLSPDQIKTINKVYAKYKLPLLYKNDGTTELTSKYRRFALVHGTATADAFEGDMNFNDGAKEVTDPRARSQYESMMKQVTNNQKFTLDNPTSIFGMNLWGGESLYEGTIYIPMVNDTISALGSTGYKTNPAEYQSIDDRQRQANAAREMNYKPGGNASNLNI